MAKYQIQNQQSFAICFKFHCLNSINLFYATGVLAYPLQTSENQRLSVFSGYCKRLLAWNRLNFNVLLFFLFYFSFGNTDLKLIKECSKFNQHKDGWVHFD